MFRSMLVAIKPVSEDRQLLASMVALAKMHRFTLEGISVIDEEQLAPRGPVPAGGGAYKADRDRHMIATARTVAAELMMQLADEARVQGVECEVAVEDGGVVEVVAAALQRSDFLVCGGSPHAVGAERALLQILLKHLPRPVLIVPPEASSGKNVVIGYDGSLPAARALGSFVASGLWQNREVHLVGIEPDTGVISRRLGAAATFLEHHEIPCHVQLLECPRGISGELMRAAERLDAGMLVMGAFGKNAIREFFVGSVTRHLLETLPFPLFLDH